MNASYLNSNDLNSDGLNSGGPNSDNSHPEFLLSKAQLDYLFSTQAIVQRAEIIYQQALAGNTHFCVHLEKLPSLADFVMEITKANYPDLNIPLHSRWQHFYIAGDNRAAILQQDVELKSTAELIKTKIDLIIVSVLLDAGAGSQWDYQDPHSGKRFSRSEGLALASLQMFVEGYFSSDPSNPRQVDVQGLMELTTNQLARGLQVTQDNPILGLQERLQLLHRLGYALQNNAELFPGGRPGGLYEYMINHDIQSIVASELFQLLMWPLAEIWPSGMAVNWLDGECYRQQFLGDTSLYTPLLSTSSSSIEDPFSALIPLHKLMLWLVLSLIEPLMQGGLLVNGIDDLPGLAEYRNGGLFIDSGVLTADDDLIAQQHEPQSAFIIEWRALTIALLNRLAKQMQEQLHKSAQQLPLAKILQGGTWQAGRVLAYQKRKPEGGPPINVNSNGTIF